MPILVENLYHLWPYYPERTQSLLISEAKQGRTWLVCGWENGTATRVTVCQELARNIMKNNRLPVFKVPKATMD